MKPSFLFFLIFAFSCSTSQQERNFKGNWYACAENGGYVEMFIKENKYKFSSDFDFPIPWNEFAISNDTLIQFNNFSIEDSLVIIKSILHFSNKNELVLDYLNSNETWTFHRIVEAVKDFENDLILRKETIERSKKIDCPDLRPHDKKINDSLNRRIGFKF